jgi:hypothetical protein
MTEAEIQYQVRLGMGRESDFRLFRNSTGVAERMRSGGRKSFERHGLAKGSSDLVGILRFVPPVVPFTIGRWVCWEIKTDIGRPTDEQIMWLELMRQFGAHACIIRSLDDAKASLDRARAGLSE